MPVLLASHHTDLCQSMIVVLVISYEQQTGLTLNLIILCFSHALSLFLLTFHGCVNAFKFYKDYVFVVVSLYASQILILMIAQSKI